MKRSMAAVAVTAAIVTSGLGSAGLAFAAESGHTSQVAHAASAVEAKQATQAEGTVTINKFVYGPYLIIVRYVKGDPLPRRLDIPMTLRQGAEQNATMSEVASLQRNYMAMARGSIQVFMLKPADPKVIKHVQRRLVHAHAHVNTGFGGEARQVARHFPYSVRR
jgi:hypothetical protein